MSGSTPFDLQYFTIQHTIFGLLAYGKIFVKDPPNKNDQVRMTNFTMSWSQAGTEYEIAEGKTILYTPAEAEAGVISSN